MSYVQRQAAHCDICGHEWLSTGEPSHCASSKCRSRKWNSKQAAVFVPKSGDGSYGPLKKSWRSMEPVQPAGVKTFTIAQLMGEPEGI
jgi:hypothetical protein